MSDKNRNMNDINDQKTAEQQAFSEEIRRRLAEPGSGKPTLDEFKVMVYKDREKRRKKRNTLVACIVAAFVVGFLSFDALVPEVGADKNPKETIVTEDGVIIEDGGYGSSEEEDGVFIIEDWEYIEDAKLIVPHILIPQYVPSGYNFERLSIDFIAEGDTISEYSFSNNKKVLEIEIIIANRGENRIEVENATRRIFSEKREIYINELENNKTATIYFNDGIIVSIWHDLSDKELIKVVDNLSS